MDWITGMQRAIDYIEENITEPVDYEEAAKRAYSSVFHFQRVFCILCGYTVGDYIRNRRLTLAGAELRSTDSKIIDIALKFGYESPESFTRAFTRFHGISPSAARADGANLKSFSRLSIKLSLEGGNIMNYRIEKKNSFKVIARTERFDGNNDVNKVEIPKFWSRCNSDGTIVKLCSYYKENGIFGNAIVGICEEDTCSKDFPYSIGTEYTDGEVADGLTVKEIPSHTWVIFECTGAMPAAMQNLWHDIYSNYFPTSDYEPYGGIDFEVYPEGNMSSNNYKSEIWISIKKK